MEEPISRKEYEEFKLRLDDEHSRMHKRVEILEGTVRQIGALTTSVEKMAVSLENMVKEQDQQGQRLSAIEGRDGEKWRNTIFEVLKAVIAAAIGFLAARLAG